MTEPFTPDNVPPDTDEYIYRYVTTVAEDQVMGVSVVVSELRQIGITQP